MLFAALSLLVFLAAAALDYVEAYYVRSVADASPARAATYSVAMYTIGIIGFVAVLDYSWWLMIPEGAGLAAGSILAIRRQRAARGETPACKVCADRCGTISTRWPSESTSDHSAHPGLCPTVGSSSMVL